jgi:hypothetical protein
MPTITVNSIVAKAQILLHDTTGVRWTTEELVNWLNDGQREICLYKPNASVKNLVHQLIGGTKQTIPSDGIQLIDIVRNMGTGGTTPGRAVRIVTREVLDAQLPGWHSSTASTEVIHYVFTSADPRNFYTFPPQPASGAKGQIEIIYATAPTDALAGSTITVDDIYQNVLLDYMMFRAYSKDSEYAANSGKATAHQNNYLASLTGKATSERSYNPNQNAVANPNAARSGES